MFSDLIDCETFKRMKRFAQTFLCKEGLDIQVALVTGSRRGIGFATAKKLAENGYRVIFSSRTPEKQIGDVKSTIEQLPNGCYYLACDISKAEDRGALFAEIDRREKRLDVLVNNAGVAPLVRQDLLKTGEESMQRVLRTNLYGTFFMCQIAANYMLEQKQKRKDESYLPRIVNISSISAYTSSTDRPEYCISKAGISMTTTLFADRLAEEQIRVFEVRPGIIDTDMTHCVHEKYHQLIESGLLPIRRFGEPEDVANAVLAACSGFLDYTTGQVLNADGGYHIRRM